MAEWLFSYGTLQLPAVQLQTYGRLLIGESDLLLGWRMEQLRITNPEVVAVSGEAEHPVAVATGAEADRILGVRFLLTPAELAETDRYEAADYLRQAVQLASGTTAWLYCGKPSVQLGSVS